MAKVTVYIDGFNLYYGVLSRNGKGLKWLNLNAWCSSKFPNDAVTIKFFTAKVTGKRSPNKPMKQQMYWRALATLKNVQIIKGNFLEKDQKITITPEVYVCGKTFEEKGTDVNLATHLVSDAYEGLFDSAVVVSNDSDMTEALRIVKERVKLPVDVWYPTKTITKSLSRYARNKFQIRHQSLKSFQFPVKITDRIGVLVKPIGW